MKNEKIIAQAKKKLALLKENSVQWLESIEDNMINCMEETDSETRETLIDTAIEQLGYLSLCVNDINETAERVLECQEKNATLKIYKSELQNSNTKKYMNMHEEEAKQLITSFVNSLITKN